MQPRIKIVSLQNTKRRRESTCPASVHLMNHHGMQYWWNARPPIKQRRHIAREESLGAAEESQMKEEPSHDQQTSTNPPHKLWNQSHFINKRTTRLEACMQLGKKVIKPEPHRPRLFSKMKKKRARRTFCWSWDWESPKPEKTVLRGLG